MQFLLAQEPIEITTLMGWLLGLFGFMALTGLAAWFVAFARISEKKAPIPFEERVLAPWKWSGMALAGFVVFSTLLMIANKAVQDKEPVPPIIDFQAAISMAAIYLLLMVVVVAWHRNVSCAKWSDFGLPTSTEQFAKDVILGFVTAAAALIPVYVVQSIIVLTLGMPSSHPLVEQLIENSTLEAYLPAFFFAVILAPVFEEFAFRVMLQSSLERLAKPLNYWPILVSSFFFAFVHQGQGYAPIPLFVLACFFGYLYRQTHRLTPCVVAHMTFNAISLIGTYVTAISGQAPGV